MPPQITHNAALGAFGENLAADHLRSLGMRILDRNWTCRYGELDIIARDGRYVVACEVKTRRGSDFGSPLDAVSVVKAQRLRRLVAHWLRTTGTVAPVRIDVIGVQIASGQRAQLEHVRGVA